MASRDYDWRKKSEWPYKGKSCPWRDPQYIKDRDRLFKRNGNGWWWFVPNKIHYPISKRVKRIKKMPKSMEKKQIVSKLGL